MSLAIFLSAAVATPSPPETAARLTVSPMAAPSQLLRYQLLPEVRELTPGNPVQWYLRCFAEQRNFFFSPEGKSQRELYLSMPLAKLRAEGPGSYGGSALSQADWGARLSAPDWEVVSRLQDEGADLRTPELEPLNILGHSLRVRMRIEVARGDFDAAITTVKTMFALARHLGEYPSSAGNLAGIAIAGLTLEGMEEMIQQPGCPNLYWALTDLPAPLVDLRKGFQGDRVVVDALLSSIRDDSAMTEDEIEAVIGGLSGRLELAREQSGRPPRGFRRQFQSLVTDRSRIGEARARLLSHADGPHIRDKIAALPIIAYPAAQVILLDEKHAFERNRDGRLAQLGLEFSNMDTLKAGAQPGEGLLADLLPAVAEARRSQARIAQRIAILRHVEALRMHAADHRGKFPRSLADVAVPLPDDPFTGKPFGYKIEGEIVFLRGEGIRHAVAIPTESRRGGR